jgi:hypothetical protein
VPIRPYLADKAAFGPDTIAAMSKAFEEACIALRVFAGDEKGREIVAKNDAWSSLNSGCSGRAA